MNKVSTFPDYVGKKILFLAETNYQIINCINMSYHLKSSICDLYLNKFYDNTSDIAQIIDSFWIFNLVRTYDNSHNRLVKAFRFVFLKKYIKSLFSNFDYDVILFASRDPLTRAVITYTKYFNPATLILSYDEGLGSYISNMETYTNLFEKLWVKFRFRDTPSLITDKVLYEPRAYVGKANNITLYQMPIIDEDVLKYVNELFNYTENMEIRNKYIYFDDYFDGTDNFKRKIIKKLVEVTNGDLLIKKHPQTSDGMYNEGVEYPYSQIPFEVIVANDYNIEDKVLITNMSTAVWTPMLLFNKYPKIIILYPIFENSAVRDIIDKLISFYDEGRIIIVDKIENLDLIKKD